MKKFWVCLREVAAQRAAYAWRFFCIDLDLDCTRNCTVSLSAGCLELLQQILGTFDYRFHFAEKRCRLRKSPCNGVPNDLSILDTVQRSRRFQFGMYRRIGERCAIAGHSRISSFRGSVCDVINISSRSVNRDKSVRQRAHGFTFFADGKLTGGKCQEANKVRARYWCRARSVSFEIFYQIVYIKIKLLLLVRK